MPIDPKLGAAYLLVSLVLTLTPGPDTMFVIATGVRHRAGGAVMAALGIAAGSLVHGLAMAAGLSAVVASSPVAFQAMKALGAAYLAWLGIRALRAAFRPKPDDDHGRQGGRAAPADVFRRGLLTNLTNPKVPLFYLATLPQFVDPSRGHPGLQLFLLSVIGTAVAAVYLVGVGVLSGRLRDQFTGGTLKRWLDGVAGTVFIGLAMRLAVTGRPER